jgi:RNA polymerase sigma-70 factor, ECF subfamily
VRWVRQGVALSAASVAPPDSAETVNSSEGNPTANFDDAPPSDDSEAEFHFGSMEMSDVLEEHPAFEDLARQLARPVMRYLERYVGDRAVAEELWQEALIRMNKGLSSFAGRSSIKTWAFSIASRVAADYFRHAARKTRIVELDEVAALADPDRAIDEQLVVDEMNECVRRVIDSLPGAYRAALILHDLEGFSGEQVAEVCDCSVALAKTRIHRARLRLKEALKEQCKFYHDPDDVFRCDSMAGHPDRHHSDHWRRNS